MSKKPEPEPEAKPKAKPRKRRGPTLEELEAYRQNNLRKYWGITDPVELQKHSLLIKD